MTKGSRAGGCAGSHYPFLTRKERDIETGLDYFGARYYASTQGRFTSADEFGGGPVEVAALGSGHPEKQALPYADITAPQSLNKYQYSLNNPLRYVDPDGHEPQNPQDPSTGVVDRIVQSVDNIIGPLIRNLQGVINGTPAEDPHRGPAALGEKQVQAYVNKVGEGMKVATDVMMVLDITGAGGAGMAGMKYATGRGSKTEVAIAYGGVILGMAGGGEGRIAFGEARALVKNWSVDTTFAKGLGKLVTHAFEGHGADVGASNLWQYLRKAAAFNKKGATMEVFEGGSRVRYLRKDGTYLITDANGRFVSYGRN